MPNRRDYSAMRQKGLEDLKEEAEAWDRKIGEESAAQVAALMEDAEPFAVKRPPRQPVSMSPLAIPSTL